MMVEKKVQTINKSADLNNLNDCHLSIQLSLDGFSFCIIKRDSNEIVAIVNYTFKNFSSTPQKHLENVIGLFKKEPLLQKSYYSVNITHVNSLSSLVPKAIFDPDQLRNYIKYSSKIYKNDYIVYDPIVNHDILNVYIPFVNVNNFFLEQFGAFEYKHSSTVLIDKLLNIYKFSERPHIFANISKSHFEIVAISNRQLILYNSFEYQTKEDFLYYLLFTSEQLKLNPEKYELIFSGLIDKKNEIYEIAYQYVRNVSLIEFRSKFKFKQEFTQDIRRHNFTLLNQYE